MKWLLKRLLLVCLTMSIFCSAAIVAGRLNHSPSKLQELGFDVCDGEPCFRGIKISNDWTTVQKLYPDGIVDKGGYLQIDLKAAPSGQILIRQSDDLTTVTSIDISKDLGDDPLPIYAADVIAQFGDPCRVYLQYADGLPNMVLIYPMLEVTFDIKMKAPDNYYDYRLQWNSPVLDFYIRDSADGNSGTCDFQTSEDFGPWYGFKFAEQYRQQNLSDLGMPQPIPDNP